MNSAELKTDIAQKIVRNLKQIEDWYSVLLKAYPPPFYSSVDIRDSGYKIVPVDNNLFPAGFNNICEFDQKNAPMLFTTQIKNVFKQLGNPDSKRVALLAENHTTNLYYLENLYQLKSIIEKAGFEVRIGRLDPPDTTEDCIEVFTSENHPLELYTFKKEGNRFLLRNFNPELIIVNNDFSNSDICKLKNIEQLLLPHPNFGWHSRKKSDHFKYYNELAEEFAKIIDIDPWHIQIQTQDVNDVDFNEEKNLEEVANTVDRFLTDSKKQFLKHHVEEKPFVFVKNNSGTYGIGIMTAESGDELKHLNRRKKNKMSVGKNKQKISSVIVQEGIPSITIVEDGGQIEFPAEPVIYLCGSELIGGFIRANTKKTDKDNLNSDGMLFKKLCVSDLKLIRAEVLGFKDLKKMHRDFISELPILELVYGHIAKLSAFAAGKELQQKQLVAC